MTSNHRRVVAVVAAASFLTLGSSCSSDGESSSGPTASEVDRPTVVVTTSILGDVVENVVGESAEVEVIMPAGTDPHEFEPSAAQVVSLNDADLIVANGLGFEEGLLDIVDAAAGDGVAVYEVGPDVDPLPFPEGFEDDHAGEGGATQDDDHADEEGSDDPHFFTDPERVADGAENIAEALGAEIPALDNDTITSQATAYADEIRAASEEIADGFSAIADEDRVLVTNHEVFGYFADRYDFEVIGAVVPGGSTAAGPSPAALGDLVQTIEDAGVPAIFVDSSSPTQLAEAVAAESGSDVEVVSLFSESLGDEGSGGETYLEMIRTNATAITDALS